MLPAFSAPPTFGSVLFVNCGRCIRGFHGEEGTMGVGEMRSEVGSESHKRRQTFPDCDSIKVPLNMLVSAFCIV